MEFAAIIAENVLGRLASHASQEVSLAWGAQLELTKLTKTLSTINLVLQDAEKKQVKNLLIAHWLGKLKDVCYDVDDVLDELEFRKLRKKVLANNHGRVKGQVRHFFSRWNPTVFNFNMGHKVKEIRERLVEIDNEKRQFALVEVPRIAEDHSVPQGMQYNQRETDSLVEASEVIGRDDDKELIFSHLLHDTTDISTEENVSVISILENFEVKSLILKIINAATDQKCEDESLDRMKRRLQDTLRGKKFLLVLDDVWDTESIGVTPEKWLDLKSLLSVGANGSGILVTTRHESVALLVNPLYMHSLKGLPHKDCMSLFIKRAFKKGEEQRYPHLIGIGEDIVNKCGGVPLAVATLGSMLYLNREPDRWSSVRDDDMWSIGNDNILPALKLSYDALPQHLKPCFASCSLFPKDFEFGSDLLVALWVAQGYLKTCKNNEDLDKMGMDYIRQFCSRSLFQVEADLKTAVLFKMHDLVHDIAISVAQTEYSTFSVGRLLRSYQVPLVVCFI
ncbi:hypothetical protein ACLB2K_057856 [Fragaria x ananassa]